MIDTEYCKFFNRIKELVRDCRKMSLCADICTVRGMAHSYLAFTTQFYSVSTIDHFFCLDDKNFISRLLLIDSRIFASMSLTSNHHTRRKIFDCSQTKFSTSMIFEKIKFRDTLSTMVVIWWRRSSTPQ